MARGSQIPFFTGDGNSMRWLCLVAIGLWVVTAAALGWLFVRGTTAAGTDGRTAILLAPAERDLILSEMRGLLQAVDGIVNGLTEADQATRKDRVAKAARSAGMAMAADNSPVLMAKLPLPFKQMGMSVHRDFDEMAARAEQGGEPAEVLRALSSITNRCTVCHAMFRLAAERAP